MKYWSGVTLLYVIILVVVMLIPAVNAGEVYTFQWSVPAVVGIKEPSGIITDSTGNVYVTEPVNNSVWKFGADGTLITRWQTYGTGNGNFSYPYGIAMNNSGFVYVTDTGTNNGIQIFTSLLL